MAKNFENFPVYIKSLDLIEKVYIFFKVRVLKKNLNLITR